MANVSPSKCSQRPQGLEPHLAPQSHQVTCLLTKVPPANQPPTLSLAPSPSTPPVLRTRSYRTWGCREKTLPRLLCFGSQDSHSECVPIFFFLRFYFFKVIST